jgi:hypothetical protein
MRGVTGAARPRSSRQPGVRAFFVQGKVSIVRIRRSTPRANVRMAVVGVSRYAALIAPSRSVTKVTGGVGGKLVAGVFEGSTEELVIPLAVLGDDQADRALRVFELRDGVEEGAAAEGGLEDPGGDVVTDSADKVAPLQRFCLLRGARGKYGRAHRAGRRGPGRPCWGGAGRTSRA